VIICFEGRLRTDLHTKSANTSSYLEIQSVLCLTLSVKSSKVCAKLTKRESNYRKGSTSMQKQLSKLLMGLMSGFWANSRSATLSASMAIALTNESYLLSLGGSTLQELAKYHRLTFFLLSAPSKHM
jgi:hypothetical protein